MPEFAHIPVMEEEVLRNLNPRSGNHYLDATVGGGGHARAILWASRPRGFVVGCDQDGAAIEAARARLAPFEGRFELHRLNFRDAGSCFAADSFAGILLDLGVSSAQLDQPERGFSFQREGPLDMRMDCRQTETAETLVNEASMETLAQIFWEFGEERRSRPLARAIVSARSVSPIRSTQQLLDIVESVLPRQGRRIHPATRVFQALRIAVNDELGALREALAGLWPLLQPGGRLLVLSFHSLEDRIVKQFARDLSRDYTVEGGVDRPELRTPCRPRLKRIHRKPVAPGPDEIRANPRARSAKLRVMEKV